MGVQSGIQVGSEAEAGGSDLPAGWGSGPCRQMVALGGSCSPAQTLSAISGGHWAATACTPKREGEMNVGCELSGSLLRGVLQGWVAEGTMCPEDTVLLTDQSARGSSESNSMACTEHSYL